MTRSRQRFGFAITVVIALFVLCLCLRRDGHVPAEEPRGHGDDPASLSPAGTPAAPTLGPTSNLPPSWAHNGSGLEPDPRARWGQLPNGLRYVIYPHPSPASRASLRLLVEAGSLMERDDQQGVAHFVEHLAFNGTRHFAAGETMERFQRLGLRSGADANASTSFDHTIYKLDLPGADDELLDEGLLFLRDVADGIVFAPQQVELERAVVLSEMRERRGKSIEQERHYRAMFPLSLISQRFPIGTEEVISTVPRRSLVEFYQKYYTANRLVLVVTGDVEIRSVERKIHARFTTLAEAKRAPDPELGPVELDRGVVAFATGPKHSRRLWMRALRPPDPGPDSPELRRRRLVREIANVVVNTRTHRSRSLLDMDCRWQEHANFAASEDFTAPIATDEWRYHLSEAAREWRRFRDLGFNEDEIVVSKTRLLRRDLAVLRRQLTQTSKALADDLVASLVKRRVHTAPEATSALRQAQAATITKQECDELFSEIWDATDVCVILPEDIEISDGEQIVDHLLAGWDRPLAAEPPRNPPELQFGALGPPGEVVLTSEDEQLGVTFVEFANGVRLNFKRLDTVRGVIDTRVSFAGGKLSIRPGDRGISECAEYLFEHGGTSSLNPYELYHATAGRAVDCGLSATGFDAFQLSGTATSNQLNLQLRLMCARLTETNWDHGDRNWQREKTRRAWARMDSLNWQWRRHTRAAAVGWDDRLIEPSGEEVVRHPLAEVTAWLREPILKAPLEVTVVGDVSLAATVRAVAETFGSLPARLPVRPVTAQIALAAWPSGEVEVVPFESADDRPDPGDKSALLELAWRPEPTPSHSEHLRLALLDRVVSDRMRREIREATGSSYSPRAEFWSDPATPSVLLFRCHVPVRRAEIAAASANLRELIGHLLGAGVTTDELERARRPMLRALALRQRDPDYWLETLDRCGAHPEKLQVTDHAEVLESTTPSDLDHLARRHLRLENACEFRYLPN